MSPSASRLISISSSGSSAGFSYSKGQARIYLICEIGDRFVIGFATIPELILERARQICELAHDSQLGIVRADSIPLILVDGSDERSVADELISAVSVSRTHSAGCLRSCLSHGRLKQVGGARSERSEGERRASPQRAILHLVSHVTTCGRATRVAFAVGSPPGHVALRPRYEFRRQRPTAPSRRSRRASASPSSSPVGGCA
jgi:hypothetical protein